MLRHTVPSLPEGHDLNRVPPKFMCVPNEATISPVSYFIEQAVRSEYQGTP